jgi:hypothetical protein
MRTLPIVLVAWASLGATSPSSQAVGAVSPPVPKQYDLSTDGHAFLLKEAENASFFMLGELHGENEIPALIRSIRRDPLLSRSHSAAESVRHRS